MGKTDRKKKHLRRHWRGKLLTLKLGKPTRNVSSVVGLCTKNAPGGVKKQKRGVPPYAAEPM